jgi:hypothetical protein
MCEAADVPTAMVFGWLTAYDVGWLNSLNASGAQWRPHC